MTQVVDIQSRQSAAKKTPPIGNGPVPPTRQYNSAVRSREYLTEKEVERLMRGATGTRYGHRDSTAILIAYRHALRVSELIELRWADVDFKTARLNVRRLKGSISSVHPLAGDEVRALRKLERENNGGEFLFLSERGGPLAPNAVGKLVAKAADRAGLSALKIHPHMLRHATGYALANKGTDTRTLQEYMGHKNIQNTVGYTALNASRFRNLWAK
jgi:site-specific recombinase XerD